MHLSIILGVAEISIDPCYSRKVDDASVCRIFIDELLAATAKGLWEVLIRGALEQRSAITAISDI